MGCAVLLPAALLAPMARAQAGDAPPGVGTAPPTGVVLATTTRSDRRLRGDWEPVDLLLVGYDPSWEVSLKQLIEESDSRVRIQVVMPDDVRGLAEAVAFRRWSRERCVTVLDADLDTPWVRDYGPVQVFERGASLWQDYHYSDERWRDDALPWALAEAHRVPMDVEAPELDGGGIASNGRGLCAITERSLAASRIDFDDRAEVEAFASALGCRALAVVPALPAEQTGHVDVAMQFLGPRTVAVASMDAELAPDDAALLDYGAWLVSAAAEALGEPLRVVRVPMWADGDVFYTYVNGTRVGDRFFVPSYQETGRPFEFEAYRALQRALPGVRLTPVPADAMVPLGGALHCITLGLNLPPTAAAARCARPRPRLARARRPKTRPH